MMLFQGEYFVYLLVPEHNYADVHNNNNTLKEDVFSIHETHICCLEYQHGDTCLPLFILLIHIFSISVFSFRKCVYCMTMCIIHLVPILQIFCGDISELVLLLMNVLVQG